MSTPGRYFRRIRPNSGVITALCVAFCSHVVHSQSIDATERKVLSDFQSVADRCDAAFKARPLEQVQLQPGGKAWVKRIFSPAQVTYDVQRTTSLVAPYSASIKVSWLVETASASSEDKARAIKRSPARDPSSVEIEWHFAFKNARWTFDSGTMTFQSPTVKENGKPKPFSTPAGEAEALANPELRPCMLPPNQASINKSLPIDLK